MKVRDVMLHEVRTCAADDSLDCAARLMWESDCGVLPVVHPDQTVAGMITDRDVCMAAYTRGRPLVSLHVGDAMARQVCSCSPGATLETAMSLMKEARVRRLPVVDAQGKLVGILSLGDLAREARRQPKGPGRSAMSVRVVDTLGTVCEPRQSIVMAATTQARHADERIGTGT